MDSMKLPSGIFFLFCLLLQVTTGKDLSLRLSGELIIHLLPSDLPSNKLDVLTKKVLSKVSNSASIPKECISVDSLEHWSAEDNDAYQATNYTITISQKGCFDGNMLTVTQIEQLGITSLSVQPAISEEAEFWQDKMNSILVFSGCAAVVLITLVTCLIMTTGCYKSKRKTNGQTINPSKRQAYQPYAIDTMTLDHRKYSRKENFESIEEGRQHEPTTIERWVNSQLSKGRRQSSAIDLLNKDSKKSPEMKVSDSHQNLSTTDSGIVTTAPRRPHTSSNHTADLRQADRPRQSQVKKGSAREPFYQEPHVMCNSIDYIQHSNAAFIRSASNDDENSFEESSHL
ncbi:uncharacterized protein [Watersipora subatra]|uniref:uncharacterized protein n=1 Tax=Watersipora subatra TaxID=2589382 RepID=UPI00355C216C